MDRWMGGIIAAAMAVAVPAAGHAQELATMLKGRWTASGNCQAGFTLDLSGNTLRLTDAAGKTDTQSVTERRPEGFATRTVASAHGQAVGSTWVYEMLAPGQLSLTEGKTGRSSDLMRCPDLLPASATPQEVVEAIYAHYAASDESNLPVSSEITTRAFFVPALADDIVAFANYSGRIADDCHPKDPFLPGLDLGDPIAAVRVNVTPDGADHAVAHVSFRSGDTPAAATITLDRLAAGWRIAEIVSAPLPSFRAAMKACAAPPK